MSTDRTDQAMLDATETGAQVDRRNSLRPDRTDPARWAPYPMLARVLSLSVFVVPVVISYLLTRLAAPLLSDLPALSRVLALGSLAVLVGIVAERVVRRVLPSPPCCG